MSQTETDIQVADINTADRVSRSMSELAKQLGWLLFSFKGRLARGQYFLSCILVYGVPLIGYFILASFFDSGLTTISDPFSSERSSNGWPAVANVVVLILAMIAIVWASFATTFKRLHDFGQSLGTYILLSIFGMIPYIGLLAPLYLMLNPGDPHANEYGQGPGWNNWSKPQGADAVHSDTATVSYKDLI